MSTFVNDNLRKEQMMMRLAALRAETRASLGALPGDSKYFADPMLHPTEFHGARGAPSGRQVPSDGGYRSLASMHAGRRRYTTPPRGRDDVSDIDVDRRRQRVFTASYYSTSSSSSKVLGLQHHHASSVLDGASVDTSSRSTSCDRRGAALLSPAVSPGKPTQEQVWRVGTTFQPQRAVLLAPNFASSPPSPRPPSSVANNTSAASTAEIIMAATMKEASQADEEDEEILKEAALHSRRQLSYPTTARYGADETSFSHALHQPVPVAAAVHPSYTFDVHRDQQLVTPSMEHRSAATQTLNGDDNRLLSIDAEIFLDYVGDQPHQRQPSTRNASVERCSTTAPSSTSFGLVADGLQGDGGSDGGGRRRDSRPREHHAHHREIALSIGPSSMALDVMESPPPFLKAFQAALEEHKIKEARDDDDGGAAVPAARAPVPTPRDDSSSAAARAAAAHGGLPRQLLRQPADIHDVVGAAVARSSLAASRSSGSSRDHRAYSSSPVQRASSPAGQVAPSAQRQRRSSSPAKSLTELRQQALAGMERLASELHNHDHHHVAVKAAIRGGSALHCDSGESDTKNSVRRPSSRGTRSHSAGSAQNEVSTSWQPHTGTEKHNTFPERLEIQRTITDDVQRAQENAAARAASTAAKVEAKQKKKCWSSSKETSLRRGRCDLQRSNNQFAAASRLHTDGGRGEAATTEYHLHSSMQKGKRNALIGASPKKLPAAAVVGLSNVNGAAEAWALQGTTAALSASCSSGIKAVRTALQVGPRVDDNLRPMPCVSAKPTAQEVARARAAAEAIRAERYHTLHQAEIRHQQRLLERDALLERQRAERAELEHKLLVSQNSGGATSGNRKRNPLQQHSPLNESSSSPIPTTRTGTAKLDESHNYSNVSGASPIFRVQL